MASSRGEVRIGGTIRLDIFVFFLNFKISLYLHQYLLWVGVKGLLKFDYVSTTVATCQMLLLVFDKLLIFASLQYLARGTEKVNPSDVIMVYLLVVIGILQNRNKVK